MTTESQSARLSSAAGESILAVDIGSATTVAVLGRPGHPGPLPWPDGGLYRTIPSAVWVNHEGLVVAGDAALAGAIADPSRGERSPKPYVGHGTVLMGGSPVPTVDLLAALLHDVVEQASQALGGLPGELRLTHPADWAGGRRRELLTAAQATDIGQVQLIPEPIAAAAEVLSVQPGALVGVVDLGADSIRTFLLRRRDTGFDFVGPPSIGEASGGDLVDAAIIAHLDQSRLGRHVQWEDVRGACSAEARAASATLMRRVHQAKVLLGNTLATEIEGPNDGARVQMTRTEMDGIIAPVAETAVEGLDAHLRHAGLGPADLDALVLVGGTSAFPMVADIVWGRTGIRPIVPPDPEAAIARGAAMTPLAMSVGRLRFYPRLAADPVVPGWNRGAEVVATLTVSKGPFQVTLQDVASLGSVESLAAAAARKWSDTNRGYVERALYPVTAFGGRGLERRFEIDGVGGAELRLERYAALENRSWVISAPEHLRYIVDGIQRRTAYSPVPGRYELLAEVQVPRGWSVSEELVVIRSETGQEATANGEVLSAEVTADSWITEQVAAADRWPGYFRVDASYATFLGDVPATLLTYHQHPAVGHPSADSYVRRVWLGVIDGVGYRITATSSYHNQGHGPLASYGAVAAHLTLVDRPPTSDLLVRAGVSLNNKLAGIRRFMREYAPAPQ